jgi:hypothetical protein
LGLVVGCTKPDHGKSSGADFYVTGVSEERSELQVIQGKSQWEVPKEAIFTLKACMKDRSTQDSIRGHKFEVKTMEGISYEVLSSTDTGGCFTWKENFPFNYFASKTLYVPFKRRIVGTGVYSGERVIEFAVNPWAVGAVARDKNDSFVLLNDGARVRDRLPEEKISSEADAMKVLSGDFGASKALSEGRASSEVARIWVSDVSLKSIQRNTLGEGVTLDMFLSMKPVLKLRDTDGNIVTKAISKGQFDITAHLVNTDTGVDENEKMIITGNGEGSSSIAYVDLNELNTEIRTPWVRRAHTGNITLALIVRPRGVEGIEPFEGLFELGGLSSLSKGASAKVLPVCGHPTEGDPADMAPNLSDKPCTGIVHHFLQDANNYEKLKKEGYASSNDPLIFDTMKLRFVSVLPGETATQRVVLYSATTCITNRFDGSKAADIPFVIEYLDDNGQVIHELDQKKPVVTDSTGCLKWNSTVHHAYYKPEHFIWHRVRIHTQKTHDNFVMVKNFALNPWDDKFTFGWDESEFNAEYMKSKKAKSRFFLPSFSYHTVRFLYNIDPYMELEVKKTVLLDLSPRVLRYAGIVNARKQTEPLRDGIYLMKVAIQKDFLDPSERPIDLKTGEPVKDVPTLQTGQRYSSSMSAEVPAVISQSLGKVIPREYITADQSLVRVVDGHMIHPIELTMRDLRLMRVRSNFMIELQTVDERKIQTHDVLNRELKNQLDLLQKSRTEKEKDRQLRAKAEDNEDPAQKAKDLEDLASKAKALRARYRSAFYEMDKQLESQPFINNDFKLDKDLLDPIKEVLMVNDFTDVKLPAKDEANLNLFVEKDSGLDARTFVGPVIFLSNAYSDSMRATDNLDEAKCSEIAQYGQHQFIEGEEDDELKALGKDLSLLSEREGIDGDPSESDLRKNKAYRYSRYYGALTHLCNKQVDDLIADERAYEDEYKKVMPVASSKANMVRTFALDYLSLENEPLSPIAPDECDKDFYCRNLRSRTLTKKHVAELLDYDLLNRAWMVDGLRYSGKPPQKVTEDNVESLLFPPLDFRNVGSNGNPMAFKRDVTEPMEVLTGCSLLSDLAMERLELLNKSPDGASYLGRLSKYLDSKRGGVTREIFRQCLVAQAKDQSAIMMDEKLKVFKTGTDYVFRGGMQLNFNVGDSVSFGRSKAWNASFKLDDIPSGLKGVFTAGGAVVGGFFGPGAIIGAGAGFLVGAAADGVVSVIKPFGLGTSTSNSNSEGTSVSAGTYLVSQMAKFDVPLVSFQRCRVLKFSNEFADQVGKQMGLHPYVKALLSKGFMACGRTVSGKDGDAALRVPETYFYFTQHFTEGDMLDQADLYNHPWLLAMRGLRDFGTFVESIEAVETTSLGGFWSGLFSPKQRESSHSWPLDHLATTYKNQLPTFPGFYTLTTYKEGITNFPLNDRFTMVETDINGEVECHLEKSNRGSRPTCAEKLTLDEGASSQTTP